MTAPHPPRSTRCFDEALVAVIEFGAESGSEAVVERHGYSFVVHPAGLAVTGTTMRLSAPCRHWQNEQFYDLSGG